MGNKNNDNKSNGLKTKWGNRFIRWNILYLRKEVSGEFHTELLPQARDLLAQHPIFQCLIPRIVRINASKKPASAQAC
jgi:hypothetical protein